MPLVKINPNTLPPTGDAKAAEKLANSKDYLNRALADLRSLSKSLNSENRLASDLVTNTLKHSLQAPPPVPAVPSEQPVALNARETEFLKWAYTELTYKELADRTCLSVRTIDGYREELFAKLGVRNRAGLVLYAIKRCMGRDD